MLCSDGYVCLTYVIPASAQFAWVIALASEGRRVHTTCKIFNYMFRTTKTISEPGKEHAESMPRAYRRN